MKSYRQNKQFEKWHLLCSFFKVLKVINQSQAKMKNGGKKKWYYWHAIISLLFQIQLLWWDHGKTESWLRCEVNSRNVPGSRPRLCSREDTGRNHEDDLSDAHSLQSRPLHSSQSRLHKWWVDIILKGELTNYKYILMFF